MVLSEHVPGEDILTHGNIVRIGNEFFYKMKRIMSFFYKHDKYKLIKFFEGEGPFIGLESPHNDLNGAFVVGKKLFTLVLDFPAVVPEKHVCFSDDRRIMVYEEEYYALENGVYKYIIPDHKVNNSILPREYEVAPCKNELYLFYLDQENKPSFCGKYLQEKDEVVEFKNENETIAFRHWEGNLILFGQLDNKSKKPWE
jgi:hypothetical protein